METYLPPRPLEDLDHQQNADLTRVATQEIKIHARSAGDEIFVTETQPETQPSEHMIAQTETSHRFQAVNIINKTVRTLSSNYQNTKITQINQRVAHPMNIDETEHLTRNIPSHITVRRRSPIVTVQKRSANYVKSSPRKTDETQEKMTQNKGSHENNSNTVNQVQQGNRLKLVEQTGEFKRYQFVMKGREEVNINWVRINDNKTGDSNNLVPGDKFNPKTIRRSAQKVTVTRNGKEEQKIVYNRD